MEGHSPHSGSHYYTAAPHSPSSATAIAATAFFNKVCANHGVPPYAPRAEHYSEMFRSFRSGLACSIPVLDLPPNDESVAAFDSVGCSGFVYSEIFGGFDFADFAVSYDELFRQSNGSQQSSDSDDAWTEVGTGSLQEESDASSCSGRNQYFLNGGVHQTTDSKFNVSYHKANKGTTEDSNPIHVAELGDVPGNSYIYDYDRSNVQKDEERYSSGVADDIILHVNSSGRISVETQSETASNPSIPSHGSDRKAGRSHGTNLSSIGISFSDVCPTAEPSYLPPSSRQPPAVVETKKDPVSSMSNFERPKGNASKALFDIGSLDFLNVELDTGSSAIPSAAAIQEAMDRAKLKLKSARESMERKMDDANGTRSVMKNDMNADGKMRMVFEESISRKDERQGEHGSGYNLFKNSGKGTQDISEASQVLPDPLQPEITLNGAAKALQRKITKSQNSSEYPKVDEESRKRETVVSEKDGNEQLNEAEKRIVSAHDLATKSLKLERSNTNRIEDEVEVTEEEMENPTKASKSENLQKMDKGDLHAELKSTEEDSYQGRHLSAKSEYSMSSIVLSTLDETNNKVPEMTCECEDLKSSSLAARPDEKNIDAMIKNAAAEVGKGVKAINGNPVPEHIKEDVRLKRKEEFERERLRELELERERERERELEKERHKKLEEERDKKKEKLHIKRLAELKEREREKKLEKDHLRKLEEERQRESEKGMEKERLRAEQAAVEREIVEARQKAMAEARERLEKACANFREKSFSEKSSTEARLRAERAAVARANAEARERAIEKAMAERTTFETQEHVERSDSEKLSSPFSDIQLRHTSSSSDLWNTDKSDEVEGQSIQRSRSRLERHCRTVERVAKAIAEKNTRDLNAQKEQAERNRLAESLDADIKRWSSGKEGNLRALLSTLQYILGQDSGWHPIPLTEVITSSAVKKAYRKATLCVHPDKLQQRGSTIQQKYICEKVFDLLKDAWNKFSSEER